MGRTYKFDSNFNNRIPTYSGKPLTLQVETYILRLLQLALHVLHGTVLQYRETCMALYICNCVLLGS